MPINTSKAETVIPIPIFSPPITAWRAAYSNLHKPAVLLALTLFFVFGLSVGAVAEPAAPIFFDVTQDDGEVIAVIERGDEFLNWLEDKDGNLLVRQGKNLDYAVWTDNGPQSNGHPATNRLHGNQHGKNTGSKGRDIAPGQLKKARQAREAMHGPTATTPDAADDLSLAAPAAESGLLKDVRRKLLVVHVLWQDADSPALNGLAPLSDAKLRELYFTGTTSVNAYYKEMFKSDTDVFVPAPGPGVDNGLMTVTVTADPAAYKLASSSVLNALIANEIYPAMRELGFSKAWYDNTANGGNGNGNVDPEELSILLMLHGYNGAFNASVAGNYTSVHSYAYLASSSDRVSDLNWFRYTVTGEYLCYSASNSVQVSIGSSSHELGHHAYGFPDMYDTNDDTYGLSNGLGYWSLMAVGGSWNSKGGPQGSSPAYADAYILTRYGYVTPTVLTPTTIGQFATSSHLDIYKITTSNSRQYFLLQPRAYYGFDMGNLGTSVLNTGGLLILHVDESAGNNNKATHQLAAVESASNRAAGGYGNYTDLFSVNAKDRFAPDTTPNSNLYSPFTRDNTAPTQEIVSGVTVGAITWDAANRTAAFQMGNVENALVPVINATSATSVRVRHGDPATLSVTAVSLDGGALSYQWYKESGAIVGATGASYQPDTTSDGASSYHVVVTNTNSAATVNKTATVASPEFIVTVYTPEYVSLTFVAEGASNVPAALTVEKGSSPVLPAMIPTKTGFDFTGWNTSADGSGQNYAAGTIISNISAALTLYAQWQIKTYTLTYNANGGSGAPPAQTFNHDGSVTVTAAQPVRSGYRFIGWFTVSASTGGMEYKAGAVYRQNANLTLYARWQSVLTLTLDGRGGVCDPVRITFLAGESVTLPTADACTRSGYTLTEWRSKTNGKGGTIYRPGQSVSLTGNTTLYAQWAVATVTRYTLTFQANGGSGAPAAITVNQGQSVTIPNTTPTLSGKDFLGWATTASATSAQYRAGDALTLTGNLTLYAVWSGGATPVIPDPPSAPGMKSATKSSITLQAIDGAEYSRDKVNWQESPTFTGLTKNTSYTFYARYAATASQSASAASPGATYKTTKK